MFEYTFNNPNVTDNTTQENVTDTIWRIKFDIQVKDGYKAVGRPYVSFFYSGGTQTRDMTDKGNGRFTYDIQSDTTTASDLTVHIETQSEAPAGVTNNVPDSTDNSTWQDDFWYLKLYADSGYKFDGDITATYTDTSGQPQTLVLTPRNPLNLVVWAYVYNTDANTHFEVTGNTRLDNEVEITNNVPDTTATGEKSGNRAASVTLTANEGFKIASAQIVFYYGYGDPVSEDMTISEGGKTATWQNDDCEPDKGVTISGETVSEGTPELNVTNNITDTLKETHTYDGETATFTVESLHYPKYRFIDPKVNYTGTDGQPESVDMEVEVLSHYSLATATVTDLDPTRPVTLTGKFIKVVKIESDFSNCYADPPLPEFLQFGETLNVTLKANANTAFDTERGTPEFCYYNEEGEPTSKYLTVSDDKKTATGSLVLQDGWENLPVIAQAYPVAVAGQQYGAINVYLVTLDELAKFSGKRFFKETGSDPETGAPQYKNIDLGAYVNKIRRVYTNIAAISTDVIRCGNYNTGVSCHQPAQDKITLDFGTAVVPAHNEDNTDYESEIQIFLPFAGFVTLNADYAGKTIGLQYVINVVTGNGVALLSCNGVVFQVEETEPCSEMIYRSPSTQVKTMGGDDWNEMLYYGLEPYIYCKWYESAGNGRNNDRQTGILGDFRGFNVFDDVTPIHTAGMLTEEQEMIYAALSDGVYIE